MEKEMSSPPPSLSLQLIQSSPLTYIWAHFKWEVGLKGGMAPIWDDGG